MTVRNCVIIFAVAAGVAAVAASGAASGDEDAVDCAAVHASPAYGRWALGDKYFRERTWEATVQFSKVTLFVLCVTAVVLLAGYIAREQNPGACCGLCSLGFILFVCWLAFSLQHVPMLLLHMSPHAEAEFVVVHPLAASVGMCWLVRWKYSDPPISYTPLDASTAVPYVGDSGDTLFHTAFDANALGGDGEDGACIDDIAGDTTEWVFATTYRDDDIKGSATAAARALEGYCDMEDSRGRSVREVAPLSFCDASGWRDAAFAKAATERRDVEKLLESYAADRYADKMHWQPKFVRVVLACQPFASYDWESLGSNFTRALASPASVDAMAAGFAECLDKGDTSTEGDTEVTVSFCSKALSFCDNLGAEVAGLLAEEVPALRQRLAVEIDDALSFLDLAHIADSAVDGDAAGDHDGVEL